MAKYSAAEARAKFNEVLQAARTEAVEISKHGKPAVVIVDAMKYEKFMEYVDDLEDTIAILEHRLNPGESSDWKPIERVVAELGLEDLADEEARG